MKPLSLILVALALATPGFAQTKSKASTKKSDYITKAGIHPHGIKIAGKKREYLLHIPKRYTGKKPTPLVLMLHGRGSSHKQAASRYYGWTKLADKEGFIVGYPNALGSPRSWKPSWGGRKTADGDFLAAVIDEIGKHLKIDTKRVFLTGHSSGGIMSFSFAATHSDRVAAIGPVAGTIGSGRFTIPKPTRPVSVISFHGMADKIVPYDKERGKGAAYAMLVGAPESVEFWAKHNGCSPKPTRTELNSKKLHLDTWADGKEGTRVEFYSIERGSHGWPSGRRGPSATPMIWKFFQEHARGLATKASSKSKRKKAKK